MEFSHIDVLIKCNTKGNIYLASNIYCMWMINGITDRFVHINPNLIYNQFYFLKNGWGSLNRYFLIKNTRKIIVYCTNLPVMPLDVNKPPNITTIIILNFWIFQNKPEKCRPGVHILVLTVILHLHQIMREL